MAASRKPGPNYHTQCLLSPPRTPGPLGRNDAAEPFLVALTGDSPGTLGRNDGADTAVTARILGQCYANGLPPPNPDAPRLTEDDYDDSARTFGMEADLIHAVADVESGRTRGFDSRGRPTILFEALWFHKFTHGLYDKKHPHISQPTWDGAKKYYSFDQWKRLNEATQLDYQAALKSASWGMFQIMGFNHSGFGSVEEFANAMFVSEYQHLSSFLSFCQDNGLIDKLKSKDWAGFAKSYNGPKYKENKYDENLQQAYEKRVKQRAAHAQ